MPISNESNKAGVAKRRKKSLVLILTVGIAILIAAIGFGALSMFGNSAAAEAAKEEISQNAEIIEMTGGIEGFSKIVSGEISTSGNSGNANISLKVLGKEEDIRVNAVLVKNRGEWKVVELYY